MAAGMAGELGPMPLSVRQRARRSRSLARRWRWRLAHSFERLRVPFLRDGIDSVSSRCICALVTMSRVRKCIRSTRSKRAHRARVPKRRAAVRCHALNDLSRVVTLPGVRRTEWERAAPCLVDWGGVGGWRIRAARAKRGRGRVASGATPVEYPCGPSVGR